MIIQDTPGQPSRPTRRTAATRPKQPKLPTFTNRMQRVPETEEAEAREDYRIFPLKRQFHSTSATHFSRVFRFSMVFMPLFDEQQMSRKVLVRIFIYILVYIPYEKW